MSATDDRSPPSAIPFTTPTARLALRPASCPPAGHVELDGAWWPRSRDLPQELPPLAGVLEPLWGRITRIAVNPRYWPILPRRIFVNGRVVKVGWFTSELDPHKILLLSGTAGPWDLLVIPPETADPSAARLLAAASAGTGPHPTASALMAAEQPDGTPSSYEAGPLRRADDAVLPAAAVSAAVAW
ncbi:hypothetical protein SAMN06272735_4511 [Streptomyces sp. TLI_55]|uniref:DUF5994 family protein n=1 Tax=Streptomyces sp. TLI_55 TaxID=1938861 RepID=UPI000BC98327|nr:DUF5994 family protein [Streptomyces sp. TLI_55]SNX62724.1 hypothetical protein SAMN06272735_4511 [Streptomyces sp. TLI_55]